MALAITITRPTRIAANRNHACGFSGRTCIPILIAAAPYSCKRVVPNGLSKRSAPRLHLHAVIRLKFLPHNLVQVVLEVGDVVFCNELKSCRSTAADIADNPGAFAGRIASTWARK